MTGLQLIQKHFTLKNIKNINKFVTRIIIKSLKDTFLEDKVCSVLHPDEVRLRFTLKITLQRYFLVRFVRTITCQMICKHAFKKKCTLLKTGLPWIRKMPNENYNNFKFYKKYRKMPKLYKLIRNHLILYLEINDTLCTNP